MDHSPSCMPQTRYENDTVRGLWSQAAGPQDRKATGMLPKLGLDQSLKVEVTCRGATDCRS